MPNMADISIKKADGTTTVVYNACQPANQQEPALFRQNAFSARAANRPTFTIMSRKSNANAQTQRLEVRFVYPILATVDGVEVVSDSIPFTGFFTIPLKISDTDLNEAVAQYTNLLSSTLVRSVISSGFAPRA